MNPLTSWRIRRAARQDAALGINSVEQLVLALLGPRPSIDPNNPRHASLVYQARPAPVQQDREEDLRARQREYAECTSPAILLPAIILIALVEFWGAIRVMKGIGVNEAERIPFGVALGAFLLVLTLLVSRRAQTEVRGQSSGARRLVTAVLFLGYAVVVGSLSYSRAQEAGNEISGAALWAEVAIMTSATLGPAWLTDVLWAAFTKARRLKQDIQQLRRDLKQADRRRRQGEVFTNRVGAQAEAWDHNAAEIRAVYTTEHRRVTASVNANHAALPEHADKE
jgi:hypothetical protein